MNHSAAGSFAWPGALSSANSEKTMNIIAAFLIVTNLGFTAAFDTARRQPAWVAYDLEPHEVVKAVRPAVPFTADPRVPGSDMDWFYRGSGFDRGHLAPSADFNWNTNAQRQTYFFSNVCPMRPRLNRGPWRMAEDDVRSLAASGTVHVVMWPVFGGSVTNGVPIPERFVKVAYGWFGVRLWNLPNE